jgi:transposase
MMRKLTGGERLWVWMRRVGMRTEDAARYWGVREEVVTDWLKDRAPLPVPLPVAVRVLRDGERLALWRRREGITLREAARRAGVSHVTLIRRERGHGDAEALLRKLEKGRD